MPLLARILIVFFFISIIGCSSTVTTPIPESAVPNSASPSNPVATGTGIAEAEGSTPGEPFRLSVAQEFNDGERLMVVADLTANTTWQTSDVLIRLRGFMNGAQVGEVTYPVSQIAPLLKAGETREIPLLLSAAGVSDYQLDLLWGEESASVLQENKAANKSAQEIALPKPGAAELRNLAVSSERVNCKEMGCELKFTMAGELANYSDQIIHEITLGTGFLWTQGASALDLSSKLPENEASIELKGLELTPGASRKIRLVLDQTVPERSDGAFRPVLRIKSYQ